MFDRLEPNGTALLYAAFPVTLSGGGITLQPIAYEGMNSLPVAIQYAETYTVHLSISNASGTIGFMLIDLDGTAVWPHTNTGHIVLKSVFIDTNTDAAFAGDLRFGFLSNVDASNGDFNIIGELHGERNSTVGSGFFDFSNYGIGLETDEWFGPTTVNDTIFQTDVGLRGPDGGTTYVSGNGDFVAKLVSSAGAADIGVTIVYTTSP